MAAWRWTRLYLAIGLWLLTATVACAATLHVIPRTDAQALVSVIAPLVGEGGYVNAYQGKLIIRAGDDEFARIQQLLKQLPDRLQNVTIYLRRNDRGSAQGGGICLQSNGVIISSGREHHASRQLYSVKTLAGHAVSISQGSLVAISGGYYPVLLSLRQGLWATPTVTADSRVKLTIEQRFDQPAADGRISTQGLATTVVLTPGQWQPLGSIRVQASGGEAGLTGAGARSRRMQLPLAVKVELH